MHDQPFAHEICNCGLLVRDCSGVHCPICGCCVKTQCRCGSEKRAEAQKETEAEVAARLRAEKQRAEQLRRDKRGC